MKEHDIVKLKEDFRDLTAGTHGTIVHCYVTAAIFEIEFSREHLGKSNITYSLHEGMLEAV